MVVADRKGDWRLAFCRKGLLEGPPLLHHQLNCSEGESVHKPYVQPTKTPLRARRNYLSQELVRREAVPIAMQFKIVKSSLDRK